jgi:hypothetical protein
MGHPSTGRSLCLLLLVVQLRCCCACMRHAARGTWTWDVGVGTVTVTRHTHTYRTGVRSAKRVPTDRTIRPWLAAMAYMGAHWAHWRMRHLESAQRSAACRLILTSFVFVVPQIFFGIISVYLRARAPHLSPRCSATGLPPATALPPLATGGHRTTTATAHRHIPHTMLALSISSSAQSQRMHSVLMLGALQSI